MSPPDPGRRERRLRLDLLVGGALLVGVLLVGKVISGGNGDADATPSPSRPSPSTISVSPSSAPVVRPTPPPAMPSPGRDLSKCPPSVRCYTQAAGNSLALEPVLDRFPKAKTVRYETVRIDTPPWTGELWYRHLQFRIDGQLLDLRVEVNDHFSEGNAGGAAGGRLFVVESVGRYRVRATFPQRAGISPDLLDRIAADDRLLIT